MLPAAVLQLAQRSPAGLFTLAELAPLGYSRTVARWVAAGLLERVVRGIYRVAGVPRAATHCLQVPLRYLARQGTDGPSALITGAGTLALHQVEGFSLPLRPLVLVERGRNVCLADAPFDVRHVRLARIPRDRVDGIDTADTAQALADLALDPGVTDRTLRVAVDDVRSRFNVSAMELASRWQRVRHRGARRLLGMLPDFEQESEGEREAFARIFRAHPPAPDCQVVVLERLRADFVFLFAALIVEYLGAVHDGQVDRDATRTLALERLGYRVILVTKSMLRDAASLAAHIHGIRIRRERLVCEGRLLRPPLPPRPPRLTPLRTLTPAG